MENSKHETYKFPLKHGVSKVNTAKDLETRTKQL